MEKTAKKISIAKTFHNQQPAQTTKTVTTRFDNSKVREKKTLQLRVLFRKTSNTTQSQTQLTVCEHPIFCNFGKTHLTTKKNPVRPKSKSDNCCTPQKNEGTIPLLNIKLS